MTVQLDEATRRQLIDKSKVAQKTKAYGTTRYVRRTHQSILSSNKSYNEIDMDALFRGDMLSFYVPIKGETDNYKVELLFENVLSRMRTFIKNNNNKFEFKTVYQAIVKTFNDNDVYISCSCPDWKYRMAVWATRGRFNSGKPEVRPADITNPHNSLGSGCKHSLAVLSNMNWVLKVASVINNYVNYIKTHYQKLYADIIFPALYGAKYTEVVKSGKYDPTQLANMMTPQDMANIDIANKERATAGRFVKGGNVNNQLHFKKHDDTTIDTELKGGK